MSFRIFVHAVNTSGQHSKERRALVHYSNCTQCGTSVGPSTHVAAHVTEYRWPMLCPTHGTLTLTTTCRRCNGAQQETGETEPACYPKARFWVCCRAGFARPICWNVSSGRAASPLFGPLHGGEGPAQSLDSDNAPTFVKRLRISIFRI